MKGHQIGILTSWYFFFHDALVDTKLLILFRTGTAPYIIGVRGSCYIGVPSVVEGVKHMMKVIKLGQAYVV